MKSLKKFTFIIVGLFFVCSPIIYFLITDKTTLLGFKFSFWMIISAVLFSMYLFFIKYFKIGYSKKQATSRQKISILIIMVVPLFLLITNKNEQADYLENKAEKPNNSVKSAKLAVVEKVVTNSTVGLENERKAYLKRHSIPLEKSQDYTNSEIDLLIKLEPFQEDIAKWKSEKFGYFLTEAFKSDYNTYSIAELEELANQNDLKALDRLSYLHMKNLDMEASLKIDKRAAALGSTWALSQIAMKTDGFSMTETGKRKQIMTKLSYLQVALIRGDKSSVRGTIAALSLYEKELNEQDIQAIQNRGRKIIANLEVERKKMGLPPFDNSIPWYVEEYNDGFNQKVINSTDIKSPLFRLNQR